MNNAPQQQQQPAAQLMDPKQAYEHLVGNVYEGVIFDTLARHYNIVPRNEKEAADILAIVGKLRAVDEDPRVKQSADQNNFFAQANSSLDREMNRYGIKAASTQEQDVSRRSLVRRLMGDATTYNATLSCKAAEAEQMAAHLGLRPQTA